MRFTLPALAPAARALAVIVMVSLVTVACGGAGVSRPTRNPELVRFAEKGESCHSTETLYIEVPGFGLVCGGGEDNYNGPLFPTEIEKLGIGSLDLSGFVSKRAIARWEKTIERRAAAFAAPRLAKRRACPTNLPVVTLKVSTYSTLKSPFGKLTVRLSPGPGRVTLSWAHLTGANVGFTRRALPKTAVDVPESGSAMVELGILGAEVGDAAWVYAESQCGTIASRQVFVQPTP